MALRPATSEEMDKLMAPKKPVGVSPAPISENGKHSVYSSLSVKNPGTGQEQKSALPEKSENNVKGGFLGNVFTGNTQKLGQAGGEAFAASANIKDYSKAAKSHSDIQYKLAKTIEEKKKLGQDTSKLEEAMQRHIEDTPKMEQFHSENTNRRLNQSFGENAKEIGGMALGTAVEATGVGALKGVKGIGLASDIVKTAGQAEKARKAYQALSFGQKAANIGKNVAKNVASIAPIGYASDIAQGLQGERGENRTGAKSLIPGLGTALSVGIPGGIGAGKLVGAGINSGSKNLAPKIINSLIKPLAKDFSYGKNPGRAVAEEGIVANSMEELGTKISSARQKTGQIIGDLSKSLEGRTKLNIDDTLGSIDSAINEANKAPRTNASLIERLQNVKKDILGVVSAEDGSEVPTRNLKNLDYGQAFEIKKLIGDLTKWTGNASDDKAVNKSLKSVYGAIKDKLNQAAIKADPRTAKLLRQMNEKYADLTSAEIATKYRDTINQRSNLVSLTGNILAGTGVVSAIASGGSTIPVVLAGIGGAALDKAMASPAVKTRLASWLSGTSKSVIQGILEKNPSIRNALYKFIQKENLSIDNSIKSLFSKPPKLLRSQPGNINPKALVASAAATAGALPLIRPKRLDNDKSMEQSAMEKAEQKYGIKFPKGFLNALIQQESSYKFDPKNPALYAGLTPEVPKELGEDFKSNTSMENVLENAANFLAKRSKIKKEDGSEMDLTTPENAVKWYVQRYVGLLPGQSRMINGEKVTYDKIYTSFKKLLEQYQ